MSYQHSGSCLCGAVRFTLKGSFEGFFLCHCQHCQKGTGTAHASNLFAPQAVLTFTQGADQTRTYNIPGTQHIRSFCAVCGSPLPSKQEDTIVVPAGSLDTPTAKRPDAHIFCSSKAEWEQELAKVPQYDLLPE